MPLRPVAQDDKADQDQERGVYINADASKGTNFPRPFHDPFLHFDNGGKHTQTSFGAQSILPNQPRRSNHLANSKTGETVKANSMTIVPSARVNLNPRLVRAWNHDGDAVFSTCRIAASGYVATPGPQATTPVNAARANGGPRGREWRRRASTCWTAAKRLSGHCFPARSGRDLLAALPSLG